MDVSIVIVNFNTCYLLPKCLSSIYENTPLLNFEIIIVDNNSSDGSQEYIKNHFPQVTLIEKKENLGFGKANNAGAEIATGKYIFLLNTDTILINNAIEILFDFMENNDGVGACGGNLYHADGRPNYSYSRVYPTLTSIFCYRVRIIKFIPVLKESFNTIDVPRKVAFIIGADCFIRKSVFNEINGFDPAFFMYVEDADISFRIARLGYFIYSVPKAKIMHLQGVSSSNVQKYRMEIESYIIYFKKFYSPLYVFAYLSIEAFYCTLKLMMLYITMKREKAKLTLVTYKYILSNLKSLTIIIK